MINDHYKLPRLYTNQPLTNDSFVDLTEGQAHYLHTVMRKKNSDHIRVFNGQDGEWLASLQDLKKKSGVLKPVEQLREQPEKDARLHLFFAPITKNRMDWMIEKAVEVGVDDLHPVITQNTEVRKIKEERVKSQIMEAAEQSERLSMPVLHPLMNLDDAMNQWNSDHSFLACLERFDARPIAKSLSFGDQNIAILIGPVGGFTEDEKSRIADRANVTAVSLGSNVLRCETAAIFALSVFQAIKP